MASLKELKSEVNRINDKYCKNSKNQLVVKGANGGYKVFLEGKTFKRGKKTYARKGSLGFGGADITSGYLSPTQALYNLYRADSKGWVKHTVRHYNKPRKDW